LKEEEEEEEEKLRTRRQEQQYQPTCACWSPALGLFFFSQTQNPCSFRAFLLLLSQTRILSTDFWGQIDRSFCPHA
jgi:hypothetical protein